MQTRTVGLIVVSLTCATAGCSGGGTGTGDQPRPGGASGGGSATGGSAGTPGMGGRTPATGGAAAGGSRGGAGGIAAAGGSRGGAGGIVSATGGTTATDTGGTGGVLATGGAAGGGGGWVGGVGGAPSGVGGAPGGGCPGVPITPDASGFVSLASNTVGIHGSWFVYSDCNDLKGKNCATVTSPTGSGFANSGGKMCTSGMTSSASGAWGAGIGLELNDGPPQMPYDTTAHGVIGFCFVLSGPTIPSTSIRVAFPTQDNNDDAYFNAVSTAGQHTVLFSDIAQGSWVTQKSPWEPTKVMLLQFQIPSATTAPVPWNFCIEGLTAVTN